jgi:hypothetical protein
VDVELSAQIGEGEQPLTHHDRDTAQLPLSLQRAPQASGNISEEPWVPSFVAEQQRLLQMVRGCL